MVEVSLFLQTVCTYGLLEVRLKQKDDKDVYETYAYHSRPSKERTLRQSHRWRHEPSNLGRPRAGTTSIARGLIPSDTVAAESVTTQKV